MATVNGKAYTMVGGPGLLQNGTGGTASSAGGFESVQPDVLQFAYTNPASSATFTAHANAKPYCVNGTPVTLGWGLGPFPYTMTAASSGLVTVTGLEDLENIGTVLPALGMGVLFLGPTVALINASVLPTGDPYNGIAAVTNQYYVIAAGLSGNSFEVASTGNTGTAINTSTGTAITKASSASMLYFNNIVSGGFTAFKTYYMVSASSSAGTFSLSATVGGSAITSTASTGAGAGMFALQTQNQVAPQISEGAGTQYQGYYQGGFRVGLQPGQAVASASSLSLDEDPQLAWQNVAGATCQTGNAAAQALGGTSGKGGAPAIVASPFGWGYVGGVSAVAGGGVVYEEKAPVIHVDDNGKPETAEHRKARLTAELNALKEKGEPTAKENARKSVVEAALKELA